jgi:hypothetical protein
MRTGLQPLQLHAVQTLQPVGRLGDEDVMRRQSGKLCVDGTRDRNNEFFFTANLHVFYPMSCILKGSVKINKN